MTKTIGWKSVTEFLAAGSIVLSLVFVGLEIRENSAIARADAYNRTSTNAAEAMRDLITDPELSSLMRRASTGEDLESFTDDELFRIRVFLQSLVQIHLSQYKAAQAGLIPMEEFRTLPGGGGAFSMPIFRDMWHSGYKNSLQADYVEFTEGLPWNAGN